MLRVMTNIYYNISFYVKFLLLVIWKVIRPLLSQAQQKAVIFVHKSEITNYIEKDQLWPHMGGTVSSMTRFKKCLFILFFPLFLSYHLISAVAHCFISYVTGPGFHFSLHSV